MAKERWVAFKRRAVLLYVYGNLVHVTCDDPQIIIEPGKNVNIIKESQLFLSDKLNITCILVIRW